jgi:glycosidase
MFALAVLLTALRESARTENYSPPPILQWFESNYATQEQRSADMFLAGYGAAWIPPTGQSDFNDDFSVGYDVYNRFDLGSPTNRTLYGTETGLKQLATIFHRFDGRLQVDAVLNHNGFSDNDYADRNNPSSQYYLFRQAGGYPGFILENPDGGTDPAGVPGTYGDFHAPGATPAYLNGQLSDLLDIGHPVYTGDAYQLIRQPVAAGNPQNIPAGVTPWSGRLANVPDPNNKRFYPDRDGPSVTYLNTRLGVNGNESGNETIYSFNLADPMAGDAVPENATGLLRRYLQWMVQVIGVDGFRLDAAKHMEQYALRQFDAAVYRSNPRLLLDGSVDNVFMYGEVVPGDGQPPGMSQQDFLYQYIRKDINPGSPNTIGGNRDVLDFALRSELSNNLQNSGIGNDWRNVVNSSMDVRDDGLHNGSAGVMFVSCHDGTPGSPAPSGADMSNVAYAYILTQPGNAIVYYNANQFDSPSPRNFPVDGRGDALGNYGNTITELVNIRNTHGRGDYRERWLEKDYFAMERSKNMLVLLDNRGDQGSSGYIQMDVDFNVGTHLVELTGNAAANGLDQAITVQSGKKVNVRFLHNGGPNGSIEDKGYLIYGVQTPQSTAGLTVTNSNGSLAGGSPPANDVYANATTRLATLPIVNANTINVRVDTQAVTLPDGFRDTDADGDNAVLRVNQGVDTNGNGHVDYVDPSNSAVYGFEEFSPGDKSAGFGSPSGNGWYQQSINATSLPEGYNYITVRAFRHRSDGGPAVFSDFKKVVYLDRVKPPAAVVSFNPSTLNPGANNRDLVVRSVDETANNMHFFMDLPATASEATILGLVGGGTGQATAYDRDSFIRAMTALQSGNHVATVVTYEPTGNYNIQRFPGLFAQTSLGLGFGDMNSTNSYTTTDIRCSSGSGACGNNSVEDVLYSQNAKFRAAFDVNGDGLGDNRDLFLLGNELVSHGAGQTVLNSYTSLLTFRGDQTGNGTTDVADMAALYNNFGNFSWQRNLHIETDANGNVITTGSAINVDDVKDLLTQILRTQPGDFNLDGRVDSADYVTFRMSGTITTGARYYQGDADFDGDVDNADLLTYWSHYGFERQPLAPLSGAALAAVPEPSSLMLVILAIGALAIERRRA